MQQTIGRYRWTICSLVFFATTINYLDRAVISLLKPTLTVAFNWTDSSSYANIELAFKASYAIGMLGVGRVIDKMGTKIGYALATVLWSISAAAHALATGTIGFMVARAFLGITESGNFPAAIKTTAEWFPKRERAFATGIFNSGSNVGAIIAPLTVPWIAIHWSWQIAFIITGSLGFVWLICWFIFYEIPSKQKRLTEAEFNYINSDLDEKMADAEHAKEKVSWRQLLGFKQTWAFAIGKFLTDPIWWFYLFWLPDFLHKQYGLQDTAIAMPVALVYTIASAGSIFGGWLPMYLIRNGWAVFKARKTAMLIYALFVVPIIFSQLAGSINMWLAVLIIALAASAHQAWSANIFTIVSDMFPKKAIGAVTGIGGMFGGIGGILLTLLVQKKMFVHFERIGKVEVGYYIMFFICGGAYILAWVIMHYLVPRMRRVEI
ncbi:MAG: MFS transporter [Ferruginibacter sp.]|nr:MFS transporter [Ferruginibacter sp.]